MRPLTRYDIERLRYELNQLIATKISKATMDEAVGKVSSMGEPIVIADARPISTISQTQYEAMVEVVAAILPDGMDRPDAVDIVRRQLEAASLQVQAGTLQDTLHRLERMAEVLTGRSYKETGKELRDIREALRAHLGL